MNLYTFTGAHSTGKTTLLHKMKEDPRFKDFKFVDEITRSIAKEGKEINEGGDEETQLAVLRSHAENIKDEDVDTKVLDRWALDGYIYTKYLNRISKSVSDYSVHKAKQLVMNHMNRFDCIFYLEPEFDIEDDGVRSTNKEFRDIVAGYFKEMIEYLKLNDVVRIVQLTGTVEERYEQILEEMGY